MYDFAKEFKERAKAGEKFADLAKDYSTISQPRKMAESWMDSEAEAWNRISPMPPSR
jgi:hypothetical protein